MTPAKEHRQPSEESKREELALVRAESDARSRFTRLKVAFDDAAVVEAAKTLWSEASAAVRDHQAKMNCSRWEGAACVTGGAATADTRRRPRREANRRPSSIA
jgi:N-methylhydantoinase B/oxoprolinase/acetone carboxylase alpha subunit